MAAASSRGTPTSNRGNANADAVVASTVACLNAGRRSDALAAIRTLDRVPDIHPIACTLLGLVAVSSGAPAEGLVWIDRALAAEPRFVKALSARATALTQLGRLSEAHVTFVLLLEIEDADPIVHYNHGNVLAAMGDRDAAIAAYDRALRLRPDYPEALRAGGAILRDSGRPDQALMFWAEALRLRPSYLEAILDRANLLDHLDRPGEALATLDAGLALHPNHAELLNNRGVVLFHMGRLEEALDSLDSALAANPLLAQAHLNKGEVRIRQGFFEVALESLAAALHLRPGYIEALCAQGIAQKLLGRLDDAGRSFDEALRLDPTSVYARTNKGELSLLLGDFETGWRDYDFRFLTRGHDRPVLGWPVPEWAGEVNPGRVLVFADQAAGDVIHFARYLPVLQSTGAAVTLVCRPRMQRVLRQASAGMNVIGAVPEHGPFDYQIPLSNMPFACKTTLANIPTAPYIAAEDALAAEWRMRLGSQGFKVGLCWRGSQDWRSDPKRSVPLDRLRPLGAIPGVRLISLQMSDNLGPDLESFAAMGIETLGKDLDKGPDGFIETVAVMAGLDLIVTCDTSIAHLAGAMGRPTFVLLQLVPEWRFMVGREDSPWYPTMRLFRQTVQDVWADPVSRLVEIVTGLAAAPPSG
jgi:tetratricopeptide (TPR) repeat protein